MLGLLSLLFLFLLGFGNLTAQETIPGLEECSGGTLFYVAYPDTVSNGFDNRFPPTHPEEFFLLIYSPVSQQVKIGRPGGGTRSFLIEANSVKEIDTKEVSVPLITVNNVPQSNSLAIESEYPIVVYGYITTHFGCYGFTAIPVESWGQQYFAATWEGDYVRNVVPAGETNFDATSKKPAPAEILIIAAYDNTVVSLQPTGALLNCVNCTRVTLRAGETYLVQSFVDTNEQTERQPDIAGTFITSNKRIGVLSGNTRTQLEKFQVGTLAGNSFKDATMEWLAPVEQHGTEFLFMPTMDDYRPRPNADPVREAEFVRIYATQEEETDVVWLNTLGQKVPGQLTPMNPKEFSYERIGATQTAIPFQTSAPAQGYQSPKSIFQFNGTTGSGNFIGASYLSWGTYMVEMVPREQWTSFSPFRAPSVQASTKHYLNLVTDTTNQFNVYFSQGTSPRQLFPFNRGTIAGTDLIWGTVSVNPGVTYIVEGDDGAVFSGFVYGNWDGYELYRPGGTKKDDDDPKDAAVAGGGENGDPTIFHPSEYEETTAQMYGFPLAPSRCVLAPPDVYEVITKQDCEAMDIEIKTKNPNPSGIKFIRLVNDPDSTFNARLEFIDPSSALALREQNVPNAKIRIVAINPLQDARAIVEFKDRTREGKIQRIYYRYEAERVNLNPADILDFGSLSINTPAGEQSVTITNPLNKDVVVKQLQLVFGNQQFRIVRTEPPFDWASGNDSIVLKSGESMKVWIDITPIHANRVYEDSLKVILGCVEVTLPLRAATVQPCLFVGDLDFETLGVGESRTRNLEICNRGKGFITFHDSSATGGGAFLTWLMSEFTVSQADIDRIRDARLLADECITISVTFRSDATGTFQTMGRFWANTRQCRDTSIWIARVTSPGPQITGYDWKERWLSNESGCTKNDTLEYFWTVQIMNNGDSDYEVEQVVIQPDPNENFRIVRTNVAPGFLMRPGQVENIDVAFKPMAESPYLDTIKLYYRIPSTGERGERSATLKGVGIESYATITDQDFGRIQFTTPGATTVTRTVTIEAQGTRPTTITGLTIGGVDAADFPNAQVVLTTPNTGLPFTLAPNESQEVEITFDPQDANPLLKNATVDIVGDFAYDVCSATDSSGVLTAEVYSLGASIVGHDFGDMLTCFEGDGFVTVSNSSTDPVMITSISQAIPANQYFTVDPAFTITLPHRLEGAGSSGSSLQIPVHFAPAVAGTYNADVTVEVMDSSQTTIVETLTAPLSGSARVINMRLSMDDSYREYPGINIDNVPVMLDGDDAPNDLAAARISSFGFSVQYDDGMMLIEDVRLGSLFPAGDGWELTIDNQLPGEITVTINNTAGRFVTGEGEALQLDFITFVGDTLSTVLDPYGVVLKAYGMNGSNVNNECVLISYDPGAAELDSVCGLNFRLIEAISGPKYSAGEAKPNVALTTTNIEFAIGLDAPTTVEVFNQSGAKVAVLVDQYLKPGVYSVTMDVTGYPSGKYFYRVSSGHWSGTNDLIISK